MSIASDHVRPHVAGAAKELSVVMAPGGEYNAASGLQAAGLSVLHDLLVPELNRLRKESSGRVRIADYGCSQAGNSVPIIKMIFEMFGNEADVILEDLPANDWTTARSVLSEAFDDVLPGPFDDIEAGFGETPQCCYSVDELSRVLDRDSGMPASVALCGISFYRQNVPASSLHIGFSSAAMQWMSHRPEEVTSGAFMFGGDPYFRDQLLTHDSSALRAWEQVAADDWRQNLRARSKELVVGGALIISVPISFEDTANDSPCFAFPMVKAVVQEIEAMDLSDAERSCLQVPAYIRTRTELHAPFASNGRFCGLEIEQSFVQQSAASYWDELSDAGPAALAAVTTRSIMAFLEGVWTQSLMGCVSEARARSIVRQLREGLYSAVLADCSGFKSCWTTAVLVIRKVEE